VSFNQRYFASKYALKVDFVPLNIEIARPVISPVEILENTEEEKTLLRVYKLFDIRIEIIAHTRIDRANHTEGIEKIKLNFEPIILVIRLNLGIFILCNLFIFIC
jgi:hypothetical protein